MSLYVRYQPIVLGGGGGTVVTGNLTDAGTDGITITNGTGAVIGTGTSISQHVADASHNGYLSSTDWSTFNSKQAALTIGNLTDTGTDGITVTGGTGAVIGSGTSLSQHVADTTHNGYLSSADWNTFSGKQSTITIGALDAQSVNATGLALVSNVLSTQSADATHPGVVNTLTQTFGGNKDFPVLATGTSTGRAVSARFADVINVMDFGAVGNGVADDTAAIQAAVTYALSLSPPATVFLPKKHLVTSSIIINRAISSTYSEFMIKGDGSGSGFYVTNTGAAFSIIDSSLSFSTDPVSEFVTFKDIEFAASSPSTVNAYVISPKFLRIKFLNCSFQQIKCLYSTIYVQTYRFDNCNIQNCPGDGSTTGKAYFFDVFGSYDVCFQNCTAEANGALIRSVGDASNATHGFRFCNNLSEGSSGSTLVLSGCYGVLIEGNFFETNGNNDVNITSTVSNDTVTVSSNFFFPTTGNTCINWGTTVNAVSIANDNRQSGASTYLHKGIANVTNFVTEGDLSASVLSDGTLPTFIGNTKFNLSTLTVPIIDAGASTSLVLKSNSTTALTIDTSQRVGIGQAPIANQGNLQVTSQIARIYSAAGTSGAPVTDRALILGNPVTASTNASVNFVNSLTTNSASWLSFSATNSSGTNAIALTLDSTGGVFVGTIGASNFSGSSSGSNTGDVTLGTASGLSLSGQALSLAVASASLTGALSSTDWSTFNGKQAAGNYVTALTGDVTASGPGSVAATVAKIQGVTVSGTTGTGNVVFSAAPTFTGTTLAAGLTLSSDLLIASATAGVGKITNNASSFTLLDNTTQSLGASGTAIVVVSNQTGGTSAVFLTNDNGISFLVGSNNTSVFSATANNATTTNVYITGGNVTVQNKTGGSVQYKAVMIKVS